jgi:tripartite-type tricarboxylate transporter receptor subunit TctC
MIRLLACIVAVCAVVSSAHAETIRVVIPYAPGGALDPLARILVNGLGKLRTPDSIIVENIGGAGGIVGMNTVAKAAPDGRTLLFSPSGNIVISPSLQSNLPYDAVTAFEPIALVGSVKTVLIVR